MIATLPFLGAGLGFREPYRADVLLGGDGVDFLEVIADHYLDAPPEKLRELDLLAERYTLIPHGLNLSLGTAEGLDPRYRDQLLDLVRRLDPPWWSEHVAFTRAGGVEIGHLAPVPFSRAALDVLAANIAEIQGRIEIPLILENITYPFALPGSDLVEADFLAELVERTGCGLLLDVANLHINGVNHHFDPYAFLGRLPLERVVQLHFVGGHREGELLVDSHSATAPPEVWALLDHVLARAGQGGDPRARREPSPFCHVARRGEARAGRLGEAAAMSLAALQQILARLVTEPELRDRFLDDPAKAAEAQGWDAELARALTTISASGLRQYGDALGNKRSREAARCLPLTCRALGYSWFRELFRAYAAGRTTQGPGRPRDDAIAFAGTLRRGPSEVSNVPPWVPDLARYEAASLRCAGPGRCMLILRLGYHPRDLAQAAIAEKPVGEVQGRFVLIFWCRLRKSGRLRGICLAPRR